MVMFEYYLQVAPILMLSLRKRGGEEVLLPPFTRASVRGGECVFFSNLPDKPIEPFASCDTNTLSCIVILLFLF